MSLLKLLISRNVIKGDSRQVKGIMKQFVFHCSSGDRYAGIIGNCQHCSMRSLVVTAETEEEAIEKFKRRGGEITEDGRIVMPEVFCDLRQD